MDDLVKQIEARYSRAKAGRASAEGVFQRIRDLCYPSGDPFQSRETPGSSNRSQVYDNTAEQAADLLAAALIGSLVNPALDWFGLRAQDGALNDRDDVKRYLAQVQTAIRMVTDSPDSRFLLEMHEAILDLVHYGSGVLFIGERVGRLPQFDARPLSECVLLEGPDGLVDTVFREWEWTAAQAYAEWGEKCGPKVVKAATDPKHQEDRFRFLHAVMPRREAPDHRKAARASLPIASYHISLTDRHLIDEGGYHEMPYVCPRWSKRAGETYGRGPGHRALPDVAVLQEISKDLMDAVELSLFPPLVVDDDGVLGEIRQHSRGLNFARGDAMRRGDPIRRMEIAGIPQLGEAYLQDMRDRVTRAYYNHLLQIDQDPRMTATQVLELSERTMQALSSVYGRLQSELLGPMIDRIFGILVRKPGVLPPPPPALQGRPLKAEFISPAVRQQRLAEVRAISQSMDVLAPLVQTKPEVLDNLDHNATFRYVFEHMGSPLRLLTPAETLKQIRAARQEEAERQAGLGQLQETLQSVGAAAPALQAIVNGQANAAGAGGARAA